MRSISLRGRGRQFRRRGFSKADLVVVILVLLFLGSLLFPAISRPRDRGGRKTQCSNQLKNVVLAMHNFESAMDQLPGRSAATPGRFSMYTDLLPYMEQRAIYDRLNLQVPAPSIVALPHAPLTYPQDQMPLNLALPECAPGGAGGPGTPAGSHRRAIATKIPAYNCPSDLGLGSVAMAGLSYVPVVSASHPDWTDRGARTAQGRLLSAMWPASSEGVNGAIESHLPTYGDRMRPGTVEGVADGSSNTIVMAERIKGVYAGGRAMPENTTWYATGKSGFVVDEQGVIVQDNSAFVARCRQSQLAGTQPMVGPGSDDLSGAQWFQYTCAWMGCANTMGPPNSPVCSAGGDRAIAESGIAAPSSFHSGGANCGFLDGTVRFINDAIDLRVFHALGTIDGGEKHSLTQ